MYLLFVSVPLDQVVIEINIKKTRPILSAQCIYELNFVSKITHKHSLRIEENSKGYDIIFICM